MPYPYHTTVTRLRYRLGCVLVAILALSARAWAEFPGTQPFAGVAYGHTERSEAPMHLFWVIIDLGSPSVSVHVSPGGADPDGDGPYQAVLAKTSVVAERDALGVAVNGDFFTAKFPADGNGALKRYTVGLWATVVGPAMTDGRRWSKGQSSSPCLVVNREGKASIVGGDKIPADAWQIVAGNVFLVQRGKKVVHENKAVHPRTAIGLDAKGEHLVLLVVDGRRPSTSVGMDYSQLADEMIRLGCDSAINLDGGGSSALVIYDPESRRHRVLNTPSDGVERPVGNVLGVRCKGGSGSTRPASNN